MALLNNTQIISRSIYEAIRKLLVREGYWPDETLGLYPDTTLGNAAWEQALKGIKENKGFIIEPFNEGSYEAKGIKKVPRIVIIQKRNLPGNIGNPPNPEMAPDPHSNKRVWAIAPPISKIIHFDIHLISNHVEQTWVLEAILEELFAARSFVPYYNNPLETFFIKQYNFYDIPDPIEGVNEKIYSYEVTDVYLSPNKVIYDNISPIKEITVETYLGETISSEKDPNDIVEGSIDTEP